MMFNGKKIIGLQLSPSQLPPWNEKWTPGKACTVQSNAMHLCDENVGGLVQPPFLNKETLESGAIGIGILEIKYIVHSTLPESKWRCYKGPMLGENDQVLSSYEYSVICTEEQFSNFKEGDRIVMWGAHWKIKDPEKPYSYNKQFFLGCGNKQHSAFYVVSGANTTHQHALGVPYEL